MSAAMHTIVFVEEEFVTKVEEQVAAAVEEAKTAGNANDVSWGELEGINNLIREIQELGDKDDPAELTSIIEDVKNLVEEKVNEEELFKDVIQNAPAGVPAVSSADEAAGEGAGTQWPPPGGDNDGDRSTVYVYYVHDALGDHKTLNLWASLATGWYFTDNESSTTSVPEKPLTSGVVLTTYYLAFQIGNNDYARFKIVAEPVAQFRVD